MENEVYVILWDKHTGYDHHAVAASKNINWAEARLKELPGDIRKEFHIRPVNVQDVDNHLVVFYDRWTPSGECSLSGFGTDPEQMPILPLDPEERLTFTLVLNQAPEKIFGKQKKKWVAGRRKERQAVRNVAPMPRPTRFYLGLGMALLLWFSILMALLTAVKIRPLTIATKDVLPVGLRFPIAYQEPVWVEHSGWHYFEGHLTNTAFKRTHDSVRWQVIDEGEIVNVVRPQVFDSATHERSEFSFASGLGDVDQWRKENFLKVLDGYYAQWPDGSQVVFDLSLDRINGRVSSEVANELFGN